MSLDTTTTTGAGEANSSFCACHNDPWALCPHWRQWGVTADTHAAAQAEAARVPNAIAAGVCPDCGTPLGEITTSGTRGCPRCRSWFAVPTVADPDSRRHAQLDNDGQLPCHTPPEARRSPHSRAGAPWLS